MWLYSYNPKSEGAAALAAALKIKRIKHEGSSLKGDPKKKIINWGASKLPDEILKCTVYNKPSAVANCSNKLTFFNKISGGKVSVPDWTNDTATAMKWVAEGLTVCARQVLNGHSAEGLVLMTKDDLKSHVEAPLYTKYIPKVHEYRAHVAFGQVIDLQRKALRNDFEGTPNFKIRNLANGYVYVRGDVNPPAVVREQALLAVQAMGLDFGAVDLIWNHKRNQAYVLEINTAPGIEGTTLQNYAAAFGKMK